MLSVPPVVRLSPPERLGELRPLPAASELGPAAPLERLVPGLGPIESR